MSGGWRAPSWPDTPESLARTRTLALVVIAVVIGTVALYLGRAFFIPVAIALLFSVLLRPAVRAMERLHLPAPAGAAIVVILFVGGMIAAGIGLSGSAQGWVADAPRQLARAQHKLTDVRNSVERVTRVAQQVQEAAGTSPTPVAGSGRGAAGPPAAASQGPSLIARVFGTTTAFLAGLAEVVVLLYLLLAAGSLFFKKLMRVVAPDETATARAVVRELQAVLERYIVVAAFIYCGQGIVVALVMWGLGMPSPILWGVATVFLELIPYIGALIMMSALALVAFTTFDGIGHIALVPATYFAISLLQANILGPIAYGRNLRLNPVAVLVSVLFWWTIWGVPGAFLAVPIIASLKVISDHTDGLQGLGEFLGA